MKKETIEFTHYWVSGFGWGNTVFVPSDFESVEYFGKDENDIVFIGINKEGGKHILKGKYI